MMHLKKDCVLLPDNIYELLVWYYNNAYESDFIMIVNIVLCDINKDFIVIKPNMNQYGHIQIGTEIFGLTMAT